MTITPAGIAGTPFAELAVAWRGELIVPGDPGYERARAVYNAFGKYPAAIARRREAADATAFAPRDGGWAGVIAGVDPDPANAGLIAEWVNDNWQDLHPPRPAAPTSTSW